MTETSQYPPFQALEGGCLCGAVRYRVGGKPLSSAHCHCRSCQKATGAAFATWARLERDDFEVTRGELAICNSSPNVSRGFCAACGSPLTYASDLWPGEVHILLPSLDEPGAVTPQGHVYLQDKLPWVKLDDGLPQYQRFPGDD